MRAGKIGPQLEQRVAARVEFPPCNDTIRYTGTKTSQSTRQSKPSLRVALAKGALIQVVYGVQARPESFPYYNLKETLQYESDPGRTRNHKDVTSLGRDCLLLR